jgi:hypothetical protein
MDTGQESGPADTDVDDTAAQILAWALVFGDAQQRFTASSTSRPTPSWTRSGGGRTASKTSGRGSGVACGAEPSGRRRGGGLHPAPC